MQYNAYGEVVRLTLPTGGYFTYRYAEAMTTTGGSGVIALTGGSYTILRRILERDEYSDGTNLSAKMLFNYGGYNTLDRVNHPSRPGSVTEIVHQTPASQIVRKEQHYFYGNPAATTPAPTWRAPKDRPLKLTQFTAT